MKIKKYFNIDILDYPEYFANTKAELLFVLLFMRPLVFILMLIFGIAALGWVISGFGALFLFWWWTEDWYILCTLGVLLDFVILYFWVEEKLEYFTPKNKKL